MSKDNEHNLKAVNIDDTARNEPLNENDVSINRFDEKAVADYLKRNPDFFERHVPLLQELSMPNTNGSKAVSLVERQVQSLREKNSKLEKRLAGFIEVARENDVLIEKIHDLSRRLIRARHLPGIFSVIESSLHSDFGVDVFSILVYRDVTGTDISAFAEKFGRGIAREDDEYNNLFANVLKSDEPRCGHLSSDQRDFLFREKKGKDVQSAAMVPLGLNGNIGLLAVGSFDLHHFNPSASTDFLKRIGDLVSQVIASRE